MPTIQVASIKPAKQTQHASACYRNLCGIGYVILSLGLSMYCLQVYFPYLNNDFIWYDFVSANTSNALINIVNMQLTLGNFLFDPSNATSGLSIHDKTGVNLAYPRMLMYQELTSLEAAIRGLRNLQPIRVTTMITQYCWVDLDKRWAMAHTRKRQQRCWERYQSNGAVYMETVLRNIDYNAWVTTTQRLFYARVAAGILDASPVSGAVFLTYLEQHEFLSIAHEVDFWKAYRIGTFQLQYSNQYQIGLQESIVIHNAMGSSWSFPIKTIPSKHRGTLRLTFYMYAGLINDLKILKGNQSLIQNSSTYFGLTDENIFEEIIVCSPLTPVLEAVHSGIGPMANIDLYWIPVPVELHRIVQFFRTSVLSRIQLDQAFSTAFTELGTYQLHPTPQQWRNKTYRFYGGNPMCGFGVALPFVQESFGFDDTCATQNALTINWTPFTSFFASMMMGGNFSTACQLLSNNEFSLCLQLVAMLKSINMDFLSSPSNIPSIDLRFLQLVSVGVNDTIHLQSQRLLESSFAYFGWMCIYEWVLQLREGVSFQGDNDIYPLLSYASTPKELPKQVVTSSVAIYLWYCCSIVSIGLAGVAVLLAILFIYYTPQKCAWFMFNRITSAVWLNRSFLLVRGVAAIFIMSSSIILPSQSNDAIFFHNTPRSLIESSLLAGEATWITYVLQEVLHPLTTRATARYAWLTSLAVWLFLIILDVWMPFTPTFVLDQSCFSENMDTMVYCTSGSIEIGSWKRALVLVCILISSVVVSSIIIVAQSKIYSQESTPSLLLPSVAVAFLDLNCTISAFHSRLDVVEAAMAGLLSIEALGKKIFFDTKLWLPLICPNEVSIENGLIMLPHARLHVTPMCVGPEQASLPIASNFRERAEKIILLGGVVYVMISLISNVTYLNVARLFLSNDFGWAGFNSSGMHTFLATLINAQLLISNNQTIKVTDSSFVDITQLYNASSTSIAWSVNAPRRQLNDPSTPLRTVVMSLRKMDPCRLPWMFTQYCYLDFKRTWTMAYSYKRQERCTEMTTNGAVYIEASFRNIRRWDRWDQCWGSSFHIGFELELLKSNQGQQWLNNVYNSTSTIDEEVIYWSANGISTFRLQWQNYKTLGMRDNFFVKSALGYSSPFTLGSYESGYHLKQQTSMRMYWTFASDLWAITTNSTLVGGKSLLSASSNFAFSNISTQNLLFENLTLIPPLNAGLTYLESTIGPFGVVDMQYINPPRELLNMYAAVLKSVNRLIVDDTVAQQEFLAIPPKSRMCQVPPFLLTNASIMVHGGNIMCGNDIPTEPASIGLLSGFGASNVCYAMFLEYISPSTIQLLYAMLAVKSTFGVRTSDLGGLCALDKCSGTSCASNLNFTLQFIEKYDHSFAGIPSLVRAAAEATRALDIQTVQYYTTASAPQNALLYRINLLEPTESHWTFYGWCLLYDWVAGTREVVKFEGDIASITTITFRDSLIAFAADPTEIPISFASILLGCNFYITWILVCVAGLIALYASVFKNYIEGINLFELNRVVGHTWAGRTTLIVRSITAIWILNTAPVYLTIVHQATHIQSPRLPAYQTILAASEVTWLVYVLNDLMSCVTQQYTSYYSVKSSLSTWLITAAWTLASPLEVTATIKRECDYIDMDYGLQCSSGVIEIGTLYGVIGVVLVAVLCVVITYKVERLLFPKRAPLNFRSLLLNSHSLYMLDFTKWKLDGDYYMDKTSAIMAGLISWRYQNHLYILDIKSWRLLVFPIASTTSSAHLHNRERFDNAIRL